jgi:alpha-glucosidase (family GH31 glycosyl hydrolase)
MKAQKFFVLATLLLSISCYSQYYLTDPKYSEDGTKFSGVLYFQGEFNPDNYHYDWTANNTKELLNPIERLNIQISLECDKYLHIYVTDAINKRWENQFSISEPYQEKIKTCSQTKTLKDFGLYISEETSEPFYITLINPENNELIFTTENTDFIYSDLFIGFGGFVSTNDIYGFGERYHELNLGDGKYTMWPNDTGGIHEDKGDGGYNAMGIHPLGFHRTSKNTFIGLLFNNINAQDIFIESGYDKWNNTVLLEHRTIGGVIDYYITINDTPDKALISLHDIIGHPMLVPYWSLGFHQCRWGYHSTQNIRDVYENYIAYELPIDTFWGDIDILQDYRIFTLNEKNFKDLPNLIYELHENNYKFVPIVDIGFPMKEEDEFYMRGKETNAFIKSNYTNEDLISHVWPGRAVFPDFFCNSGVELWKYAMERYYQTVKYDGIWLDMNEPAMIYVDDENRGEILPEGKTFDPNMNRYEYLPYIPGYRKDHPNIRTRSLSENSYSNSLNENEFLYGYNFKPLMNYIENMITNADIISITNKRPFILSRSTALGHGKYSFHWLGDNTADYEHMRNGVNGIFQFQIYGVPMTGDDICGFFNDSWDELCARWMSLGSFFPFSRNHNHADYKSQEPYVFGKNSLTYKSSKLALNMKYSLLRYYYTNLFKVSLGEKGSFFKPLFFEYYSDLNTTLDMAESFMIGDSFIIYPIYKNETDDIEVYMPKDDWNIFPTGEIYKSKGNWTGGKIKLSGEYNKIHIFMRGGKIFPYQNTFNKFIPNTKALNKEKTELYIIPDSETHIANGDIIFDNDEYDTLSSKNYYYIHIEFYMNMMIFSTNNEMKTNYENKDIYVSKLKFFRMKYLENEKYDIARVELKNGKVVHVLINYLSDDIFEFDLSNNNIRFYEIDRVLFIKNN